MSVDAPPPASGVDSQPDATAPHATAASGPRDFPSHSMMVGLVAAILVLDQLTKALVREYLPLHASVSIVPGFLDFTYVRNTGAAFGLMNTADIPFKSPLMTAIALFALIAIAVYTSRVSSDQPVAKVGLSLILGGAIGNLIDRVTAGYVVDFVDVYWGTWHFWAFNGADAAITVGASCLILDMAILNRHVSETV